jgi:hypothetical protein
MLCISNKENVVFLTVNVIVIYLYYFTKQPAVAFLYMLSLSPAVPAAADPSIPSPPLKPA